MIDNQLVYHDGIIVSRQGRCHADGGNNDGEQNHKSTFHFETFSGNDKKHKKNVLNKSDRLVSIESYQLIN